MKLVILITVMVSVSVFMFLSSCDSTKGTMMDNTPEPEPVLTYKNVVEVGEEFTIQVAAPSGYDFLFSFVYDLNYPEMVQSRMVPYNEYTYRKAGFYHGIVYCKNEYGVAKQAYFHIKVQ